MHVPVLHIPQIYYFVAFSTFMASPILLQRVLIMKAASAMVRTPL